MDNLRNEKALLPEYELKVDVPGGQLAVHRFGPQGGRPIVAVHGVTSSNRAWQCFAGALVPHGFTIYAPDLRGRGHSNQLPPPFGMENHARDVVALLDHLNLDRVDVVGHSMGGFVTVAMLARYPERVAKAVLIDGGIPLGLPPGMTADQVLPLVLGPALARLAMTFESRDAYRDYWRVQPAFVKGWGNVHDEYSDFDLQGNPPALRPRTNKDAVEEDSRDLFESDLISTTLANLDRELPLLRAQRGLQNEEVPLYPDPILNAVLPSYPRVKRIDVADVNHYDILLEQSGADRCAEIIYGVK